MSTGDTTGTGIRRWTGSLAARLIDRLPRRIGAPVGVLAVLAGAGLILHPFAATETLLLLAGVVSIGVALARRDVATPVLVALGVVVLAVPGTVAQYGDYAVGLSMVAIGSRRLVAQRRRPVAVLGGTCLIVYGVLAACYPAVTVLVLALSFGVWTAGVGVALIVRRRPGRTRARRGAATVRAVGLAVGLIVLLNTAVLIARQPSPGAAYDWSAAAPSTPGRLLRVSTYDHGVPDGARAWLIVYSTRSQSGEPTIGSAVVLVPTARTRAPRHVVLWDHGTTGVARHCAPSLETAPFDDVPTVGAAVRRGWAVVAPDYPGTGTAGPASYLLGPAEAYAGLDALRAAHDLPARVLGGATLSADAVVWGHSQGGHAALWTGILARRYAPGVTLDGVAALSPATDLRLLVRALDGEFGGSLPAAYLVQAYAATYSDVERDDLVRVGARAAVAVIAGGCAFDAQVPLNSLTTLGQSIYVGDPASGAYGRRLDQNTPDAAIAAPLLVQQGGSDETIPVAITRRWAAARCGDGQRLAFQQYPGVSHTGVLTSPAAGSALLAWTADRFAGRAAPSTC